MKITIIKLNKMVVLKRTRVCVCGVKLGLLNLVEY